jgi:hypothetical protein
MGSQISHQTQEGGGGERGEKLVMNNQGRKAEKGDEAVIVVAVMHGSGSCGGNR